MKAYIMRGVPGSGKSTWIKALIRPEVASADDYFAQRTFSEDLLKEAHDWCLRIFVGAVRREAPLIVVDNTNIRLYEFAPYYRMAEAHGYDVELVHIVCDPAVAEARCVHNLPPGKVRSMWLAFEPAPAWWKTKIVMGG